MATYNPRVLALALEDLQGEIARWASMASDMMVSASTTQRHAKEAIDRAVHTAAIVVDRSEDDEQRVKDASFSVSEALDQCSTAKTSARRTYTFGKNALEEATSTLSHWESELGQALQWMARAEARLTEAVRELERAVGAMRSAEWELSAAESRLSSCINDPNRRGGCGGEAAAVERARSEVAAARRWAAAAEQEVQAAREDLELAKARVACCRNAVALSTRAVALAAETLSIADQAVNSSERSWEFAQAAKLQVDEADAHSLAESRAAIDMSEQVSRARTEVDDAGVHFQAAEAAGDSAQTISSSVSRELAYRVQALYVLDLPDLADSVDLRGSSTHSRDLGRPPKRAVIQFGDVDVLPEPDDISGGAAFAHHATEAGLRVAIQRWEEMKPRIVSGEGEGSDYWAAQDRAKGLEYQDGYQRVYDTFYGSQHIRVEKTGNDFSIIHGRHRIWLAKRMGIRELPMEIVEVGQ